MSLLPPVAVRRLHRLLENEGFIKTWPCQYAASFAGGGIALLAFNWAAFRFIEFVPVRIALEFGVALTGMALSEQCYQQLMFKYSSRPTDVANIVMSALSSQDHATLCELFSKQKDDWKESQKFVRQHKEEILSALARKDD